MSFSKETVFGNEGQEIIEVQTEEEDKAWREKHRANVKKYKQCKIKEEDSKQVTDEELWERLEELELQEELTELKIKNEQLENETNVVKEPDWSKEEKKTISLIPGDNSQTIKNEKIVKFEQDGLTNDDFADSKLQLLQKVLNKQNDLEEKLIELKNRERSNSKTELDFIKKLDEMEELDELEDEMDR